MHSEPDNAALPLDPETCRQARLARDSRFDGEFFLAVRTTGIYCRPVCPARPPAEKNVTYYRSATEAAAAGFRPCLRCRPESAPLSPAWLGSATTVRRALALIEAGALNDGPVEALAERLGVGERYLRKLFQRELGASPLSVAQNQRLLFARKLLAETSMPITDIAFAAGFGSVRRFNSAVQESFRTTPGRLRGRKKRTVPEGEITLQLQYRPPYDWDGVLGFFARHAIEGVDAVTDGYYHRRLMLAGEEANLRVCRQADKSALRVHLQVQDPRRLMPLVARLRRVFDLDSHPRAIAGHLGRDPALASLLQRFPGVRSPVHWSLFEAAVRTVAGQQVSVSGARTVCARLVAHSGSRGFPDPAVLAALPDSAYAMPGRRRETLRGVCALFARDEDEPTVEQLAALPGIGPWTIDMVAMRGRGDSDRFPAADLGLQRAWEALPATDQSTAPRASDWSPWGSYAANLLWRSL